MVASMNRRTNTNTLDAVYTVRGGYGVYSGWANVYWGRGGDGTVRYGPMWRSREAAERMKGINTRVLYRIHVIPKEYPEG